MKFLIFSVVFTFSVVAGQGPAQGDPCAPDCFIAENGQTFAHPQDCQLWYQCDNLVPYLRQCPGGLQFNSVNGVCDFPANVNCLADPNFNCEGKTTTTATQDKTTEAPQEPKETTTAKPVKTTVTVPTTEAEDCTPPCPSPSALYGDPRDCTMYFHCAKNVPYHKPCPPGQEYWIEKERCDWPSSAKCTADPEAPCVAVTAGVTNTVTVPTTKLTTVNNTTVKPVKTTVIVPTNKLTTTTETEDCTPPCPSPSALYGDPRDCTMYFHCAKNVPYHKPCPPGQEYWIEKERCDWPSSAKCTADPNAPCVAVTSGVTTTTAASASSAKPGDQCLPECPSSDAIFPHPQDCTKFIHCGYNHPYIYNCPSGQEYWASMERCDYPENAQCTLTADSPCVAVTNPPK